MSWETSDFPNAAKDPPEPIDHEIELLLAGMPLRPPSSRLDARVWRVLNELCPVRRLHGLSLRIAAAAAIVLGAALLLVHNLRPPGPSELTRITPAAQVRPTAVSLNRLRVERDARRLLDRGIIGFQGDVPIRAYRYQSVRQIWYFDPKSKTRLAVTVPQDQLVLVPVRTF